jgi:hypothetical protein
LQRLRALKLALLALALLAVAYMVACSRESEPGEEEDEDVTANGCGVERWSVKTGTDPDVAKVSLNAIDTTIAALVGLAAPTTLPPKNRIAPTEDQAFRMTDVTLTGFKLESDSDIHLILSDGTHTMNAEIPAPACVNSGSPFAAAIARVRQIFTAKHTPGSSFTNVNETISLVGVGFFDAPHGQKGGAANGAELHPALDLCFGQGCTLSGGFGDGGVDGGGDGGTTGALPPIKTVFVVLMENHNFSQIKGSASAPYINGTLLPMGAHAENYQNVPGIHPSEPNYIWLESGDNLGITNDDLPSTNHQSTTQHLVTLLEGAGISWKAYAEGASGTSCPVTNSGLYAPKHVPFVFFDDVRTNAARCTAHVRPYSELAGDLASGNVARYNFITPNLCDDMHNSTGCATSDEVANGDTWLSQEMPKILASSAYQDGGAVFLTFDESEGGDFAIAMIVLSPFAKPGYANSIAYDHSSTLRTMQEIFGVQPFLRAAAGATDLADLFVTGGPGDAGTDAAADAGSDAADTCAHPICATGARLVASCDPCVASVCQKDSFCCAKSWDAQCVGEVTSVCGRSCP